ncbi:hypothetical protein CBR_g29546 [Chara braunii]|uniref:DDE Tnp4 domain-containing protein n=1 Tax=Chara braunii TaxID=69332 RepID=A0A388LAP9_CHABU|nr:hypothetical protein CBR_g29546 [Chara braunii]|eukprot:GBG79397.1 hypothetical protein CBR_g29546 [Chara braunii]
MMETTTTSSGPPSDVAMWPGYEKFKVVQDILDQNRLLITEINHNHEMRLPENLTRNVQLIRQLNDNAAKIVEVYGEISASFVKAFGNQKREGRLSPLRESWAACEVSCGREEHRAHLRQRWQALPVRGEWVMEMDVRGGGHGLCEEEREAVAMAVTAVVLDTVSDMSSTDRDMRLQLRKRRALLQRVVEAPGCVATSEAVVQLCSALSSGMFAACAAHVEKKVTHYRMPLLVEQVIAFALYRWASGETYESDTSAFGIGRATGLQAIRDVTSALLKAYPDWIKWPVGRRCVQILRTFLAKGFPNCFGAIDSTHVYIDKPADALSDNYYDRKQKFSVQAEVVVDLDLRILDVHVGYPGSVHDVLVLHNSHLWRHAESGELFDAPPENLPHSVVTRGCLLGDNGYPDGNKAAANQATPTSHCRAGGKLTDTRLNVDDMSTICLSGQWCAECAILTENGVTASF